VAYKRDSGQHVKAIIAELNVYHTSFIVVIDDRLLWHVAKLREFNVQCDAGCQFSDADISSLEPLVSRQQVPTPAQLETLWRMMQWPAGSVDCWYTVHEITGFSAGEQWLCQVTSGDDGSSHWHSHTAGS